MHIFLSSRLAIILYECVIHNFFEAIAYNYAFYIINSKL